LEVPSSAGPPSGIDYPAVAGADVKPENILLGPGNQVWLADFGIATSIGSIPRTPYGKQELRGTVRYMAPEQIRGTPLPASDQYALAVMIYEWLCGAPPYSGTEIAVLVI
jgi:serine/threonine protein kinase